MEDVSPSTNVLELLDSKTFFEPHEVNLLLERFCTHHRRLPNDSFFLHTDQLLALDSLPGMQRLGVYSVLEERPIPPPDAIASLCNVPGCKRSFNTDHEFERHYSRSHRFQCSQCHRMLPNEHLLDLHLSEEHDSFFAARLASQPDSPWFVCFLKECSTVSRTRDERKDHCIREHRFPVHFRFEPTSKMTTVLHPEAMDESSVADHKSSGPVRFVNFGHSKQKTFQPKKPQKVDHGDYAKVLTKNKNMPNVSRAGSSQDMNKQFVVDMLDCLE